MKARRGLKYCSNLSVWLHISFYMVNKMTEFHLVCGPLPLAEIRSYSLEKASWKRMPNCPLWIGSVCLLFFPEGLLPPLPFDSDWQLQQVVVSKLLQVNYENDVHLLKDDCKLLLADQNNELPWCSSTLGIYSTLFLPSCQQLQLVHPNESVFRFLMVWGRMLTVGTVL